MAQVAFAMQLPPLSEAQEGRVRRYGQDHCDEIRLVKSEGATVFAGILTTAFSNKKTAQTAFGGNLKAWGITKPKYVRDWYRELSLDEYFTEFKGVVRVLGSQMQKRVTYTVNKASWMGAHTAIIRANAVLAEASAKAASKEMACRRLAAIMIRPQRACFDTLTEPVRQRQQELDAMRSADYQSHRAADAHKQEEKLKARLKHEALLKTSYKYREQITREKIAREREEQAVNVAAFHERRKREADANVAAFNEGRKREEEQRGADVTAVDEGRKRKAEHQ
jgi:hypothetical protein